MSDTEKGTVISIRKPRTQLLEAELIGLTDLICSAHPETIDKKEAKAARKKAARAGGLPDETDDAAPTGTPDEQYRASLYRLPGEEGFVFPSAGPQRALATYMQRFNPINPKYARDTPPVVFGATFMLDEMVPILSGEAKAKPYMRHDIARNSRGKLIDVYRGAFKDWRIVLRIEFDADVITKDRLIDGLYHAGRKVGIGAWRPERGGRFGRFTIGAVALTKGAAEEVAA